MRCPMEGEIQAYIDGETDLAVSEEIKEHLLGCPACMNTYNSLIEINNFIEEKLFIYDKSIYENNDISIKPFKKIRSDTKINLRRVGYDIMLKNRKILASACAVLMLVLCITIQPVRAAISSALSIFRVENVKSISINVGDLTKIQREIAAHKSNIDLDKLGSVKTTGGKPREISAADASSIPDFKVLIPAINPGLSSRIKTTDPGRIQFDLNIANVNSLLSSLGADKLLPESLNGKTFSIDVPRMLNIEYTNGTKRINIIETKTPELQVPSDVNVDELYNSLTELPILPDNLQRQLKSIKDWKNTMYVPVVESHMDEIDINGVKAFASDIKTEAADGSKTSDSISSETNEQKMSSYVIWFKDGVFYEVNGNVDRSELINIAKSMR